MQKIHKLNKMFATYAFVCLNISNFAQYYGALCKLY